MKLQAGELLQVKQRTPCLRFVNSHDTFYLPAGDFVIFLNDISSMFSGILVAEVIHPKVGKVECLLEDLRVPRKINYKNKMEKQ